MSESPRLPIVNPCVFILPHFTALGVVASSGKAPSESESDCDTYHVGYTGGYTGGSLDSNDSVVTVAVQEGVTSIGDGSFFGCTDITTISVHSSVTSIGKWAFCDCTGLTTTTIPSSVTSIGDAIGSFAFYGCTGLTTITFPSSVTSISDDVFYGCTGLTTITILTESDGFHTRCTPRIRPERRMRQGNR